MNTSCKQYAGPTYGACKSLSHIMTLAEDGYVIILEDGNVEYNIDYTINITGFKDLIFSGLRSKDSEISNSILTFDFKSNHDVYNETFFNIINCDNITFQELRLKGTKNEAQKVFDIKSLFNIENSTNIKFENVVFEEFNLKNPINNSMIGGDSFSFISTAHKYESFPTYESLTTSQIPLNYPLPSIPSTHCSYVNDRNGVKYCYNSPQCNDDGQICTNVTNTTTGIIEEECSDCIPVCDHLVFDVGFVPGKCQRDTVDGVTLSYKYECFRLGNTSNAFGVNKSVYTGSSDCTPLDDDSVQHYFFNESNENITFYCNPLDFEGAEGGVRDECILRGDVYDAVYENGTNGTCTKGEDLTETHYIVTNDCILEEDGSTGWVCVDDKRLFMIKYSDEQCTIPQFTTYIDGTAWFDNQCFVTKLGQHVYYDFSCPLANIYSSQNESYSVTCIGCIFRENQLQNGYLIQAIGSTDHQKLDLVDDALIPIEINLIDTVFTKNIAGLYMKNVIVQMDGCTFDTNTVDGEGNAIAIDYDSNLLMYYFMHFDDYSHVTRIANSTFSRFDSDIFSIDASIDLDALIVFDGNVFSNNSGVSIIKFYSHSDGLYFLNTSDTDYCHKVLCTPRLSIQNSEFVDNDLGQYYYALQAYIWHNFTETFSEFSGYFEDEISIRNCTFSNNSRTLYPWYMPQIVYIDYDYYTVSGADIAEYKSIWNMLFVEDTVFEDNAGGLLFYFNQDERDHVSYDSTAKYIHIKTSQIMNSGPGLSFQNLQYIGLEVFDSNISGNDLGGLYVTTSDGTSINIQSCQFSKNEAFLILHYFNRLIGV